MFVNDILHAATHSQIFLFADVCKIPYSFKNESACKFLQEDINNVHKWCIKNELDLNIKNANLYLILVKSILVKIAY